MSDEADSPSGHPVAAMLPDALAHAVAGYQEFAKQLAPEPAKEFVAFHNGCKAALGHIATLLKLESLIPKNTLAASDNIEAMLRYTRHVLLTAEPSHDPEENQL
jgi:hypothetical protein